MNLLEASTHIDDDSKTQIISKCLHDSYSFFFIRFTRLILLKTRNTCQESSKDACPILQSTFNSRE